MTRFAAALPMYDWPPERQLVDRSWETLRARLNAAGLNAPAVLARANGDLPPVPGGISGRDGRIAAPDPASLPPDAFDLAVLWRHPALLLAQTCWGPLENTDLGDHVAIIGQPDYSKFAGGEGAFYSSAVVMRADPLDEPDVAPPPDGGSRLPVERLQGARVAFNSDDSMSGWIALCRDLAAAGAPPSIFPERTRSGSHLASAEAVAMDRADVAAIDCRTWTLVRHHQPAIAARLRVVGWTARRRGLPYISSRKLARHHATLRRVVADWIARG